jgi:hypothetical protein
VKGREGWERESVTIIRIDDEKGREGGAWSKEAETWDGVFSSKLRA